MSPHPLALHSPRCTYTQSHVYTDAQGITVHCKVTDIYWWQSANVPSPCTGRNMLTSQDRKYNCVKDFNMHLTMHRGRGGCTKIHVYKKRSHVEAMLASLNLDYIPGISMVIGPLLLYYMYAMSSQCKKDVTVSAFCTIEVDDILSLQWNNYVEKADCRHLTQLNIKSTHS